MQRQSHRQGERHLHSDRDPSSEGKQGGRRMLPESESESGGDKDKGMTENES